jgi:NifU-like protein involved in Fe-S cluster formation
MDANALKTHDFVHGSALKVLSFQLSDDYFQSMSSDLYSGRILELAADIPNIGSLPAFHGQATKVARLCGSVVHVEVALDRDVVSAFAIEPKACALGQASASILSRSIIGATRMQVKDAYDAFKAMLKQNGSPPEGLFWELRYLAPVADYPPRHASALLAFEAALAAIDQALERVSIHSDRSCAQK